MLIEEFIESLKASRLFATEIAHHKKLAPKEPYFVPFPDELSPILKNAVEKMGIKALYSHQKLSFELVKEKKNIVVVTPTASGKTLCYNLPILNHLIENPSARSLYLFPMKALEQDQLKALNELIVAGGLENKIRAKIYDGDTKRSERERILSDFPQIIISNPDMVHLSIIPYHNKWKDFIANLEFIVLDELHSYKGVFGSHIAQVLRRLERIANHYNAHPKIIASSATIANPKELAQKLTSKEFEVISQSGASQSARHFLFLNPTVLSTNTLSARLFQHAVLAGFRTIVFTKARKITELIYSWVVQNSPDLRDKISAYRAGYLPEERREIEQKLFSARLLGVVSTSALEMGIDIGELDICILVGYPGTITTTWQRGGRVGREDRESAIILVAQANPLDQHFIKHPERFFSSSFESAVVDPENLPILKSHILCAASELKIEKNDKFFPPSYFKEAFAELEREGELLKAVSDGSYHSRRRFPQRDVDIRSVGESFTIFEAPALELPPGKKPKVIGTIDGYRCFTECHEGAIYLHRGNQYEVVELDLERKNIYVEKVDVDYYTQALTEKETEILETKKSKPVKSFIARLGRLKVTEHIIGYEKKRISSQERLSVHQLDLPPIIFETVGLWIEIDDFIQELIRMEGGNFMGAIHAIEHCAISLFPLFALCDRDDVGGISITFHYQLKKAGIFIYDGYPGGVGLSERCYEVIEELLEQTLETIESCDCELGCPSCIHSPKCGSGNVPLDKISAKLVLKLLLDKEEAKSLMKDAQEKNRKGGLEFLSPKENTELKEIEPRIIFFDLETKRGAEEVGGWSNIHLMGMALSVVFDSVDKCFKTYFEEDVEELIKKLKTADLVVGFNLFRFDYLVLSAYSPLDFSKLPTLDIHQEIYQKLGYMLSLSHLVEMNLGAKKMADGLQSLKWVKNGRIDLVEEYCRKDVELTRDLFYLAQERGYLVFRNQQGIELKLKTEWDLKEILKRK